MKSRISQLLASCASAAVAATLVMTGPVAAHAAATPGPLLGSLTMTLPDGGSVTSGTDTDPITVTSSGPCVLADSAPAYLQVTMTGTGFPTGGQNVTSNAPASNYTMDGNGYDVPLQNTFANFAAEQLPAATLSGKYVLTLVCKDAFDTEESGTYVGDLYFTDPHHWTTIAPVVATTTTLSASPAGTATTGASVTLTATVTPSGATGSVQFLDGATDLGSPVVVSGTTATLTTTALTTATHSLTAVFTPTAPLGATPSTSAALGYVVAAPPVVVQPPTVSQASTVHLGVGTRVVCPAGGGTEALPAGALDTVISCNSGGPGIFVEKGLPLENLIAPSLVGSGKVGKALVLKPGLWIPAPTSRTLTWRRDGKVIAGVTGASYTVKKADKGHHITVTVVVHKAGYADGLASTAGVKASLVPSAMSVTPSLKQTPSLVSAAPIGVPVGSPIACEAATFTGATSTTAGWLLDGSPSSLPQVFVIGGTLVGHSLTCHSTGTGGGGTTVSNALVTVVPGAALLGYVTPSIVGVAKVGKKLTVTPGKWFPVYTKVTFTWLRGSKVIKGATKATYVLTKADAKTKVSVEVTVTRTGWGTGKAKSAAVSVG